MQYHIIAIPLVNGFIKAFYREMNNSILTLFICGTASYADQEVSRLLT